ncbi:zinc transporter ZntB [Breoghania sp. L-A4]|uniref:zinc transporter ZntB n=1 Tax=Breoghania sp. L-A4 TaxID=2304600 RepID=UPI0013C2CD5B|nr:zinc transporter ZntB [Breoghania sp. L-A4]
MDIHSGLQESDEDEGLICAFERRDDRITLPLDWAGVEAPPAAGRWRWVHMNRASDRAARYLEETSGLDPLVVEALLMEDTRPRCAPMSDGTLIILRGVNLNPNSSPEDMVSIRLWVEEHRVISLRQRQVYAVQSIRQAWEAGHGPDSPADFVCDLALGLSDQISAVIREIEDNVDRLEEEDEEMTHTALRASLMDVRRTAVPFRRYLSPQRDVFLQLNALKASWLDEDARIRLHAVGDHTMRQVEDLDAVRERATILAEELNTRLSEQLNRNMYLLSLVAAIFLPLGLITGLFGINVGGIPLAGEPMGFAVVSIALLVLVGVEIALFKLLKWI